ncbi:site-specific integrase [Hylemonella gracilis]|uniref:Site-specific integrase n=1 Tax=Hylemonella gracilis TaxID=80880 RepID=A0A4P6UK56_9BURK|nr:site-specific integrase [Hylemonella gracilis]QBK04490.1 site-specific integrase [Hylemonella gracilis]
MTRYPRQGKGRRWTVKELEAVPNDWTGDVLNDGDGLNGEVRAKQDGSLTIAWRYAFKWEGKLKWFYCGTWPDASLEAIRRERDSARELVKTGVNPSDQRKAGRIEAQAKVKAVIDEAERQTVENLPVRAMYEAWLADGVARKGDNADLIREFTKDVLPAIGDMPVRSVTEHHIRELLRAMIKRDACSMADRVCADMVQLFSWAEKRKPWRGLMVDGNPMDLIEFEKLLPPGKKGRKARDRVLDADEIRELQLILKSMEEAYEDAPKGEKHKAQHPLKKETQLALWICLSTACRIGELLKARWEHIDLKKGEWFIPSENAKQVRGGTPDHLVYLSEFTLNQFKALHQLTGRSEWCFPARSAGIGLHSKKPTDTHVCEKSVSKQIGDRQCRFKKRAQLKNRRNDDSLVLSQGGNGAWTPHDLRRTAATMMQMLHVPLEVIDRCQNHVLPGSKVRRHYMHYDYADETRHAWEKLGNHLEQLLT